VSAIPDPQVYRDAADVIRRNGHHKGDFFDRAAALLRQLPPSECPVCMLGAVNVAVVGDPTDEAGRALAARRWLHDVCVEYAGGAATWNDADRRTVDEVLAMLGRAAAAAEAARAAEAGGAK
jgi:hypothetical protein